jgi:hypothetical protein
VSSVRYQGVIFQLFPSDHEPRHAHGLYAGMQVIVELRPDRTVALARRPDAITPSGAKRSDVRKVLNVAAEHFDELVELWERMHP